MKNIMITELWVGALLFNVALSVYLFPMLIKKGRGQNNYSKINFGYSFIAASFGWSFEILHTLSPAYLIFRLLAVFFLCITVSFNYSVFAHFIYPNKKVLNIVRWIGILFGLLIILLQSEYYAFPILSLFSIPYALMIMFIMSKTLKSSPQSIFIFVAALMSILAGFLVFFQIDINNFIPFSAVWHLLLFWAFFK